MFRNFSTEKGKDSFEIHNVDIAIANGIRRIILTDIPIPGIIGDETIEASTVDMIKNNGPLHNEIMAHRIGLIPICLDEDDVENYEDGSIEIELNVINERTETLNVTSGDIKGKKNGVDISKKDIMRMFPANDITKSHILITRLRTNEQLHFKASIVKRTARFNASFSPVSLSNFFYVEDPDIAKTKESVLDKQRSYYKNKYGEPTVLKFEIEPINPNIGSRYLVNKSIEIIIDKLDKLVASLNKECSNGIKDNCILSKFENLENTYEFKIENEDDTLGNIIQSFIHDKHIRNKKSSQVIKCSYVGYICPHPLKTEMIIRLTLEEQTKPEVFVDFLVDQCQSIVDELILMKSEWNSFTK
jgi:DNA-directed RNA polymerase subunit L